MKTRTMIKMMTAAVVATAIGSSASAGTIFNTTTNNLGNNQYQLVDTFTLNFDLSVIYVDSDLNGTIDSTIDATAYPTSYDGEYIDPENYVLDFSGDVFYDQSQMTMSGTVDWALTYVDTPGDITSARSTILFGTMSGGILTVRDGIEWPVNPVNAPPYGSASAGERWGFALGDFTTFTWDSANGTLAANVVPGPFGVLALAGFGVARRRRDR